MSQQIQIAGNIEQITSHFTIFSWEIGYTEASMFFVVTHSYKQFYASMKSITFFIPIVLFALSSHLCLQFVNVSVQHMIHMSMDREKSFCRGDAACLPPTDHTM